MKILLFANTDWYLYNFRQSLASAIVARGDDLLLVSPPGPYGEKLIALGFRWLPAPMDRRSLNPLREVVFLRWLWRLMRHERPDVVHGFTIKCAVYGSVAARLSGAARVNAVAGLGYVFSSKDIKSRLLRPLVRSIMRITLGGRDAKVILQNPDDVKLFTRTKIARPEQIRLIAGSGVNISRFAALENGGGLRNDGFRAVFCGRMLWDKGIGELVEAARLLRREGRTISFLLAGAPDPGNPAAIPEATLRNWEAEGIITWLGHIVDVPSLLANADVVVLASYREGLPRSLIEAASCARPLITTDVPGCREVVCDGVDGLLVPARDFVSLGRAIARLQDNPQLAKRLGAAARRKALLHFDERIVIERTLAVYDEVTRSSAFPGPGNPL